MYRVYDCGKPADFRHCDVHPEWNNSLFNTQAEAISYAIKWLGIWAPQNWLELSVGKVYEYGLDSWIEIREVTVLPKRKPE